MSINMVMDMDIDLIKACFLFLIPQYQLPIEKKFVKYASRYNKFAAREPASRKRLLKKK